MGLFDFLFGKNKKENVNVQHSEEDPNHVQVYAKVSDGTAEGMPVEEAVGLMEEMKKVLESNDLGKLSAYNMQLMNAQQYDQMIAFNQQIITQYPETNAVGNSHNFIGVAHFFKKEYAKAIEHYRLSAAHGIDINMVDDNVWEATEKLYKETGDPSYLEDYKEKSPEGSYIKKANKLLK